VQVDQTVLAPVAALVNNYANGIASAGFFNIKLCIPSPKNTTGPP
jgi:hypothetical protein